MSYQQSIITGNLGKPPEMKYTPSGQAVTSFSVAVNEQYTNKAGEKIKRVIWFRVETWGKQAETCKQYLDKGSLVLVVGTLKADPTTGGPRVYQKTDGSYAASFELTAQTVRFLSGTKSAAVSEVAHDGDGQQAPEEDLPF